MPTSGTGRRPDEDGFTLIELMVVITLLGLASAVVALAIPDGRGEARKTAGALAARAVLARDLAIVDSRDTRLRIDADGYVLEQRRDGAWRAAEGRAGRPQPWPAGVRPEVSGGFVFDTTGGAADARVSLEDAASRVEVVATPDGQVRVTP